MTVGNVGALLSDSYPYPEILADQLCNLAVRSCVMFPFSERAFPEQMAAFRESVPAAEPSTSDDPTAVNDRLLAAADDVKSFFARRLWTDVLNPELEGVSASIVATPYRDTVFESAVHATFDPRWKVEVYLHATPDSPTELETVRAAKTDYLRSLRDGRYLTATAAEAKLTEIRAKTDLFDYPDCCGDRFLEERERRLEALLSVGSDRVRRLQTEHEDADARAAAFGELLEAEGIDPRELNPESRIVEQLEYMNMGAYFEDWSDEELREFYRSRTTEPLPEFFYAFFTGDYYPHHPRCEESVALGRQIESTLEAETPALVEAYRATLMTNVFATLGFDDHGKHRLLLDDLLTENGSVER
jgi:hypothetical protein